MAPIPGSPFRRVLFWLHLCCGVAAGAFILAMSVTGVLLAYEHQFVEHAAGRNRVTAPAGAARLDADRLASIARDSAPAGGRISLVFDADPAVPVTVTRGRDGATLLNPYTGEVIDDAAAGARRFFRVVEDGHRWLWGETRGARAALIDYGNLLFLALVVSGIYLWLPHAWRWRTVRGLMLFQRKYINAKVRDFNWHHVASFWMLIPLLLISASGVVMSFDWANRLVYAAYGEQVPVRRGPPGGGPQGSPSGAAEAAGERATLEAVRAAAAGAVEHWQRLTLPLDGRGAQIEATLELASTDRRAPRRTVTIGAADASVIRVSPVQGAEAQSAGQRARTWLRFVHTGEQYGVIGQTLAALASLAACLLVYTGLALAYRRLLRPLFRRPSPA
jgi:uncharacterized iron-regulated membrane protein